MSTYDLANHQALVIQQRRELAEFIGFETRNKYEIRTESGMTIGFAAEQHKGFLGFIMRQFLGHWRRFEIHFFDNNRNLILTAEHPFRFFFQRLEIRDQKTGHIGALQQRFSILSKKFDVEDFRGQVVLTVNSPIWKIWTFPFLRGDRELAVIQKKWSGLFKEAFLDTDNFRIEYKSTELGEKERNLILAAGIFIDLQYFERKASS